MSVQQNIERLNQLRQLAKDHVLTARISETEHNVTILFAETNGGVDGVRVASQKNGGMAAAYETAIKRCDAIYNEEWSIFSHHVPLKTI